MRDLNARSLASKRARDIQFYSLLALHGFVIIGAAGFLFLAANRAENYQARLDLINQESVAWAK